MIRNIGGEGVNFWRRIRNAYLTWRMHRRSLTARPSSERPDDGHAEDRGRRQRDL